VFVKYVKKKLQKKLMQKDIVILKVGQKMQADTGMNVFVMQRKTLKNILMIYGRLNKNQRQVQKELQKENVKFVVLKKQS